MLICLMYSYVQDKYLMTKTTPIPDVVDDDDDHTPPTADSAVEDETMRKTTPL
jgi:hypothetical protein